MNALQGTLALEQQEKAKITERSASQEFHRQEQQNEIERLHQLLKHVQHNLEHYQTATQQLRQEQSLSMEKQRNEYEQRISQLQQQIANITAEKSSYQAQYEQTHLALENLQSNYEVLNQTAQEMQTKYHSLSQENTRVTQQHQDQLHDYELKKQSVIELQIRLAAYEDKITLLEKNLAKADDKIQILRDEKLYLTRDKAQLEGQLKKLEWIVENHMGASAN